MVLSELLPGAEPQRRQAIRADFEQQMQAAHLALNGESLHSYCAQENFCREFVASAVQRYQSVVGTGQRIFIAVNLFNSERVLPNMATQLLAFSEALGRQRIFLSIYENGSTDRTKSILRGFDETLRSLEIPHCIIADPRPRPRSYHRIDYMAHIRNRALQPLYEQEGVYERVVFLNDIFFCLPDLFELLLQSRVHRAHLTCGEDFELRHGILEFYDTWVSRDLLGRAFRGRYQNIADDGRALVGQLRNRPYQVQCCWNGLAVIDARVFYGAASLRFRRSGHGECSASECSLLCNDMWRAGYNRTLIVPRVKVAYSIQARDQLRQPSRFPRDQPFSDRAPAEMAFGPGPAAVYCHPLNGMDTDVPDGPATYTPLL
ncbi:hypothetical protein GGF46_004197 [Coemansia sp. RSA 552]|nr:hypothetical protein GGF46_004197 [Coemansia sp. RSA 552]